METTKKTQGFKAAKRSEYVFYWSLILLPFLQFIVFYVIVNLNSFKLAFQEYNGQTFEYTFAGFKNFKNIFKDSAISTAVGYSVKAYFLGLINLPLSLFFSFYVYKKMFGAELFKVVLFLPSILSSLVLGLIYHQIVDGVIPEIMFNEFNVKIDPLLSTPNTQFASAFAFSFFMGFGGHILMYTGAMARIPESVVEYAKLEGVGPFREFFTITFPLIFPTVGTFFILGFAGFFTNQLGLYTFFGDGADVQTVGYYVYNLVYGSSKEGTYPQASAIGLFFTLIIAPLTMLFRYLINRFDPSESY